MSDDNDPIRRIPVEVMDMPFERVHGWFGLSYANYLVLPRTLLQSMPQEWQDRFVTCLEQVADAYHHVPQADSYRVTAVNSDGKFVRDPVPHYQRGRARIEPRIGEQQ